MYAECIDWCNVVIGSPVIHSWVEPAHQAPHGCTKSVIHPVTGISVPTVYVGHKCLRQLNQYAKRFGHAFNGEYNK